MKKLLFTLVIASLTLLSLNGLSAEHHDQDVQKPEVELTDDQKKEMEELHNELFEVHKKILNKYAEYGVLSEEKVESKIEHMEKYHEKLKENGYIPDWHHKKDKMKDKMEDKR